MSIDYKTYQAKYVRKIRGWQWLFLGCLMGLGLSLSLTLEKSWKERWSGFEFKALWKGAKQPWRENNQNDLPKSKITVEEPKFDFYNVLPEMEVVIPPEEGQNASVHTSTPKNFNQSSLPITPVYILQVAAFKAQAEAEHLKAALALIGFQAGIETSTMPSGATWYRVKLGPYASETTVDKDKQKLQEQGIRSFKVKIEG